MTIIVHHLQRSQSERVVWLLEELGLPYELRIYRRDSQLMAPPELKAIHPAGTAPVMQDGDLTLSESSAIMEYILQRYAPNSPLVVPASAPSFPDYIFWLHWSIGTLQGTITQSFFMTMAQVPPEHPAAKILQARLTTALGMLDARLRQTGAWLAGEQFTAADIYPLFALTTQRPYTQLSLKGYDGILAWLQRVGHRPAYRRVGEKGEQGEDRSPWPVLGAEAPAPLMPGSR